MCKVTFILIYYLRLSFMKKILPKYFDSEFSYAQFRIPDNRSLCAFSNDDSLIVVTLDGNYYLAEMPSKSGDCVKKMQK